MEKNYDIKREGTKQLCKFHFEWTDVNDVEQVVDTDDIELAQTIIGLLTGEICLADLEP